MKYLKLFEDFDSEEIFKDYFSRSKDVNLDFDLEYIKYAKKLSKVKKTDPKYGLQVKAKDVMMQDVISIPKGNFIVLNDFKYGKFIFKKDSEIKSDGLGNLEINFNGNTKNIVALGPKRGFERFYLNFYTNTQRVNKKESPFDDSQINLLKLFLSNDNKATAEEITNFLQGFSTTALKEIEPRKEKIYRDAAIYSINSKFKQAGYGDNDLIMLPHGRRIKGQPIDFNYRLNPEYVDILNTII
jgi:hypothetical protein